MMECLIYIILIEDIFLRIYGSGVWQGKLGMFPVPRKNSMALLRGRHRVFGAHASILYSYNAENSNSDDASIVQFLATEYSPSAPVENYANKV